MSTTLTALQKQRTDTATNWSSANPTLLLGEIGYESDTGKFKIGDGSTAWTSLAYRPGSQISTYPIVNADIAAAAEIAVSKLADGSARQLLQTDAAGSGVEWASNIDIPGTLDVTGNVTFDGNLTVKGTTTEVSSVDISTKDRNIHLAKVAAGSFTGNCAASAATITNVSDTTNLAPGVVVAISSGGGSVTLGTAKVLTVDSTTQVTLDINFGGSSSATGVTFSAGGPTNVTANTGGLTLEAGSDTDKTWQWTSSTASWTSSENIDLASGKVLKVAGTQVLSASNYTGTSAVATSITVADESSDTTCFPLFAVSATGNLGAKSGSNLTFNSSTGALAATSFTGAVTGAVTGNADTATALETARTIGGVSFNGTANINLPGVNTAGNQDTSGTATNATHINVADNESTDENDLIPFIENASATGNVGLESDGDFHYNPSTGTVTATIFSGALSGNATTATTATTATNANHVAVTDNESTDENNLITFIESASQTGNVGLQSDGDFYYNPSTGRLTATQLAGTLQTAAQGNITSLGTLSALTITGDLTVDTDTLKVDSSNNRVGIGDSSPTKTLTVGTATPVLLLDDQSSRTLEIYGPSSTKNAAIGTASNHDLTFFTNGYANEHLRISNGGNVGIGNSTLTGYSGQTNVFLGGTGNFMAETAAGAGDSVHINQNAFVDSDGSWEYLVTDEAANIYLNAGDIGFRTAASGTAGNDITWANLALMENAGAVKLYYNGGNPRFETTNNGVDVKNAGDARFYVKDTTNSETWGVRAYSGNTEVGTHTAHDWGIHRNNSQIADVMDGKIRFSDNKKATFGGSDDLEIYHDINHSYISHTGTGNFYIYGNGINDLVLRADSGKESIKCIHDAEVIIYHDDSPKLETTADGAKVTGELGVTGDVGIGDTSPDSILDVEKESSTAYPFNTEQSGTYAYSPYAHEINIKNLEKGTANSFTGIHFHAGEHATNGYNSTARISAVNTGDYKADLVFATRNTNFGERLRIKANGDVNIGTTVDAIGIDTGNNTGINLIESGRIYIKSNDHSECNIIGGGEAIRFRYGYTDGTTQAHAGDIEVTAVNAVAYTSTSDYRLKENEVAISDGITRLKQLKPYKFNFKSEPSKTLDGFFAHEVTPLVPEAITGTKDGTEDILYTNTDTIPSGKSIGDVKETVPRYQGIDQSKLVPLLTAALQEAITKIETLETKVAALEAA